MVVMTEFTYRGIALSQIEIISVTWPDVEHIRTRTERYEDTETSIEPEWAIEAALDSFRMLFLPNSGTSLGVIGWSPTMQLVLKLWLQPVDMAAGYWAGASAAKVKRSVAMKYWSERS